MTKQTEEIDKPTIDFKLATIRRDCVDLAVKACGENFREVVPLANNMYSFIIGEDVSKLVGWK